MADTWKSKMTLLKEYTTSNSEGGDKEFDVEQEQSRDIGWLRL